MIFVVTAVNYGDRATLSIAGTEVAKELGLSAVSMGYIFSAFGWAYLLMQITAAGCWINLARKRFIHTVCFSGHCLPSCKALLMCSRSPGPGSPCSLCVLCWAFPKRPRFPPTPALWRPRFPAKERGTASAIFNAAQYFSLALFSPLLGWLTFALGWEHVFTVMGIIGFVLTIIWVKFVHNPTDHPRMSAAELKYISEGGAVVDMDHKKRPPRRPGRRWTISASC